MPQKDDDPPPRSFDEAYEADLRQLERVCDWLAEYFPDLKGQPIDEAIIGLVERLQAEQRPAQLLAVQLAADLDGLKRKVNAAEGSLSAALGEPNGILAELVEVVVNRVVPNNAKPTAPGDPEPADPEPPDPPPVGADALPELLAGIRDELARDKPESESLSFSAWTLSHITAQAVLHLAEEVELLRARGKNGYSARPPQLDAAAVDGVRRFLADANKGAPGASILDLQGRVAELQKIINPTDGRTPADVLKEEP